MHTHPTILLLSGLPSQICVVGDCTIAHVVVMLAMRVAGPSTGDLAPPVHKSVWRLAGSDWRKVPVFTDAEAKPERRNSWHHTGQCPPQPVSSYTELNPWSSGPAASMERLPFMPQAHFTSTIAGGDREHCIRFCMWASVEEVDAHFSTCHHRLVLNISPGGGILVPLTGLFNECTSSGLVTKSPAINSEAVKEGHVKNN